MTRNAASAGTPSPSHRKRLLALSAALLSDALGKTGAMHHDVKCMSANARMAGPACTLRVHTADILMVGKAVSVCPKGSVLVIDGRGERNTALWGGLTTLAARLKGLEGVVIDGAVRDIDDIRRDRFPVFARAVVPNAGGAEYVGELDVPVQCAGVVVNPGDWVLGDDDGAVVIPASRLVDAIETAERLRAVEKDIGREILSGRDLALLLGYDELLAGKSKEALLPQMRFKTQEVKRQKAAR